MSPPTPWEAQTAPRMMGKGGKGPIGGRPQGAWVLQMGPSHELLGADARTRPPQASDSAPDSAADTGALVLGFPREQTPDPGPHLRPGAQLTSGHFFQSHSNS